MFTLHARSRDVALSTVRELPGPPHIAEVALPPDTPFLEVLIGAGYLTVSDVLALGDLTVIKGIGPGRAKTIAVFLGRLANG